MANIGGIIAGALAGGADAAQGIAKGWIENEQKLDSAREVGKVQSQQRLSLEQELSKVEEARQMRIAEAASKTRLSEKQAGIDMELANAPRMTEAEAERQRVVGGIKCVIVNEALRDLEPMAWDFVMNFARDNDLQVSEACLLPDTRGG